MAETLNLQASAVAAGDPTLPQVMAIPTKPTNSLATECLPPMLTIVRRAGIRCNQGIYP